MNAKKIFITAAAVTTGVAVALLTTQPSTANPPSIFFPTPKNFAVTNIQSSTDLVHWADEPYTVSNTIWVVQSHGRTTLFIRFEGTNE